MFWWNCSDVGTWLFMAGALSGEVALSLFVGGLIFAEVAVMSECSSAWQALWWSCSVTFRRQVNIGSSGCDVEVLLFLAGAIFGEVAMMLECHFSWQVHYFVAWDNFLTGSRTECCIDTQNAPMRSLHWPTFNFGDDSSGGSIHFSSQNCVRPWV